MDNYVNVTIPSSEVPWTTGIVNQFEWSKVVWDTSQGNYSQDQPFNVSIMPADLPAIPGGEGTSMLGPSGADLVATFTIQGPDGSIGVDIPAKTHSGSYKLQFQYDAIGSGGYFETFVFFSYNFTMIKLYDGSTAPLKGPFFFGDSASRLTSGAGLASLAVASVMACVFVFPALF